MKADHTVMKIMNHVTVQRFLDMMMYVSRECESIGKKPRGQNQNKNWHNMRVGLITASNVKKVMCSTKDPKYQDKSVSNFCEVNAELRPLMLACFIKSTWRCGESKEVMHAALSDVRTPVTKTSVPESHFSEKQKADENLSCIIQTKQNHLYIIIKC